MNIRTAYSPRERLRTPVGDQPTMAKQSFKDSCDINNILSKYQKTGVLSHYSNHVGEYGFATSDNYYDAQLLIAKAESMFAELPAKARKHFDNNAAKFLDYVENVTDDDESRAVMRELGLMAEDAPSYDERVERFTKSRTGDQNEAPTPPSDPEPE